MSKVEFKDFMPLISHQVGIKIKNKIIEVIRENDDMIILDFDGVNICTDSFLTQITGSLIDEIGYEKYKAQVKFTNINDFIKDMIKAKLAALR